MRCIVAVLLLTLLLFAPPLQAADQSASRSSVRGPHWVSPAHSGSWFQLDRSGEGFILEILPDGNSVAAWFTFPGAGEAGEQIWLVATGGEMRGDTLIFEQVYRSRGGRSARLSIRPRCGRNSGAAGNSSSTTATAPRCATAAMKPMAKARASWCD